MARFGEKVVFESRVCKCERSSMVARFGANIVFGSRVLMGAKAECSGGSFIREDGFRELCVGEFKVRALSSLASANILFSGVGPLVGGKPQRFGRSLLR